MFDSLPFYQTYILKLWQERSSSGDSKVFRFSLEDPATQVRYGFRTLDEMVQFLKQQCDADEPP
ncbi:hypothetical protein [Candidatus Leptofilum sp.]|uniref:hypothetical protein n=1 Tax=Candidatus Leptofilum sp. TaxID=3241576 RepID=UPI003B5CF94A